MKENQHKKIWNYLEDHPEGITPMDAFMNLHITKLSTRAGEMIALGYPIIKTPEVYVNADGGHSRFMRYKKAGNVA